MKKKMPRKEKIDTIEKLAARMEAGFASIRAEMAEGFENARKENEWLEAKMDAGFENARKENERLEAKMNAGFENARKENERLEAKMDAGFKSIRTEMDTKIESVRADMEAGFEKLATMMAEGFDDTEKRFGSVERRLDRIEGDVQETRSVLERMDTRLAALELAVFGASASGGRLTRDSLMGRIDRLEKTVFGGKKSK